MKPFSRRGTAAALLVPAMLVGLASVASAQNPTMAGMPGMDHGNMAGMDMGLPPVKIPAGSNYTEADVRFMQGMIAHHAQAIYMSHMAAAHNASPRLIRFAGKIDQSQRAEIKLMQDWLNSNKQFATDTASWHHIQMAGMLTAEQLKSLDAAQGAEFDRLFLEYMIQHHEGALKMVSDLFATPMAGQEIDVSVFANDVVVVQTAEIGVMRRMLNAQ